MIKYLLIILVFLCPISKVEAKTEQAEIERLSTLMYKYYSSDSIDLFMSVTDSLKQICLKSGDEQPMPSAKRAARKVWPSRRQSVHTLRSTTANGAFILRPIPMLP